MPPRGPGICPMAPNLEYSESTQFACHFGTKHAILSSIWEEIAEEIVKEKVRFLCRSYRIFCPDSFLGISTYSRNFATKSNFKALTKTL